MLNVENIKTLRENKNLTQEQLWEKSDVSIGTIRDIERGANKNPTYKTMKKLEGVLL